MHGSIPRRLLGGALIAGFAGMLAGTPAALGQKKAPADPTRKPAARRTTSAPTMTAAQLARHIDSSILADLKAEKTDPSPACSDEEFVRRVYLDLAGKIPTAAQALQFLDGNEPNKRARLIDDLLAGKGFASHQADLWTTLLLPVNSDNRPLVQFYPNMKRWLEGQFNAGAGWDATVRAIMTAGGEVDKTGPAIYWLANPTADKMTDNVTRMFLGVQLQCAQCHNHPFTDVKQDEYWQMAAFFLKVRPEGNPRAAAKKGGPIKVGEAARAVGKRRGLPESARILPPKFLKGGKPPVRPADPLRPVLADWMTAPNNPYLGRALVNRVWGQLFGRGFVNPVDDMHDGNPAAHPALLAALQRQFVANGFDVKYLYRAVCNSRTYQRTSRPAGNNLDAAPELFARMPIKPLTGEQMFDSLVTLAGPPAGPTPPLRPGMMARFGGNPRAAFVAFFAAEDGADPTEYHAGIPQVLRLMNAPALRGAGALGAVVRDARGPAEVIERMYLTALARRPTPEEIDRVNAFLRKNKDDPRRGYAGVLWALLNSSEFALNR